MTPEEAAAFHEDDEDPAEVFARFDAGAQVVTAAPADWQTDAAAQIEWGLNCIRTTYGGSDAQ